PKRVEKGKQTLPYSAALAASTERRVFGGKRYRHRAVCKWYILQAVGFVRVESGPAQAVLPLVGLAADKVIRGRYNSDDAVECLLARTVERVPGELE
ncbi:MAG: hypothetical protein ACQESR_18970, partial [Planctomycetota bacterium]